MALVLTSVEGYAMSQLDVKALEANFEGWTNDRMPTSSPGTAFERFAIELILKDADLSDEEIDSGMIGGPDDGGVDGLYFFVDRELIQDDSELPKSATTVRLVLIQAKYETSFGETVPQKLQTFIRDLLNYDASIDSFEHLNHRAREAMSRFRDAYEAVMATALGLQVDFYYATRADRAPHPKVERHVELLKKTVRDHITDAQPTFEFLGAQMLLSTARATPKKSETIPIGARFTSDDESVVCLVKLPDFAKFLTDEQGRIRRPILEPNVRDYQGTQNPVNKDIRASLISSKPGEFWWLNNGITILVTECNIAGNSLKIETPEIVNGLQTCHEIFSCFKENPDKVDVRHVLVRIIPPPNKQVHSEIIKATNNQTAVQAVSLRANDQIHFDIEDRFKLYGLFYDRRKGEYRAKKKPIGQIISVRALAQAVMAMLLQRPDDARARPTTSLKKKDVYPRIFGDDYDRDLYVTCILIDRRVAKYLKARKENIPEQTRVNIHYYVDMAVMCLLLGSHKRPAVKDVAPMFEKVRDSLQTQDLDRACSITLAAYEEHGGDDRAAKGPQMKQTVLSKIEQEFTQSGGGID